MPAMPASPMGASLCSAYFTSGLATCSQPGKSSGGGPQFLAPCHPHEKSEWKSWLLMAVHFIPDTTAT